MRKITAAGKHSGKRIDRVLRDMFPNLPAGALYRALRKRDVRVNGVRVREDYTVSEKDILEIYIIDEILEGAASESDSGPDKGFSTVYEDANILVVNKAQGIPVHPDRGQSEGTLIDLVNGYLEEKNGVRGNPPGSFMPSLCHRLDRNTGGLVLVAKTPAALEILLEKIKIGEVKKYYQCLVYGRPEKDSGELRAYLEKDARKSRVFISGQRKSGSLEIITRYRVLSFEEDVGSLEIELVTGRTHQIRAHMAYIGHPVIGDGKYGTNEINRRYGAKKQQLWACKILFDFKGYSGVLDYLKGRSFEVEPEFRIKAKV